MLTSPHYSLSSPLLPSRRRQLGEELKMLNAKAALWNNTARRTGWRSERAKGCFWAAAPDWLISFWCIKPFSVVKQVRLQLSWSGWSRLTWICQGQAEAAALKCRNSAWGWLWAVATLAVSWLSRLDLKLHDRMKLSDISEWQDAFSGVSEHLLNDVNCF